MIVAMVSPLTVVPTVLPIINGIAVMVPVPVFRRAWGHVIVDGPGNDHGCGPDHDRMSVNDRVRVYSRRRNIADVQIKARLADADGHAHIGCVCCGSSEKGDHYGD
jgi:hypothetical protein